MDIKTDIKRTILVVSIILVMVIGANTGLSYFAAAASTARSIYLDVNAASPELHGFMQDVDRYWRQHRQLPTWGSDMAWSNHMRMRTEGLESVRYARGDVIATFRGRSIQHGAIVLRPTISRGRDRSLAGWECLTDIRELDRADFGYFKCTEADIAEQKHYSPSEPSFDCAAARTDVELAICSYDGLSALDREIDRTYRELSSPGSASSSLSGSQRQWIRERERQCSKKYGKELVECIRFSTESRLAELYGLRSASLRPSLACSASHNEGCADDDFMNRLKSDVYEGAMKCYEPRHLGFSSNSFALMPTQEAARRLRLLRNEIFARKGYTFGTADLQKEFFTTGWYQPAHSKVELNEIELWNVNFIQAIEGMFDDGLDVTWERIQSIHNKMIKALPVACR